MNFVDELKTHLEDGVETSHGRRKRRRRLAVAAEVTAIAGLITLGGVTFFGRDTRSQVETEPTVPTSVAAPEPTDTPSQESEADPAIDNPAIDSFEPLLGLPVPADNAAPVTANALDLVGSVVVSTGDELFVWGGTVGFGSGSVTGTDGVLYDIETGTSRPLPPAPGGPQSEAAGVWTGSEVLICCGQNADFSAADAIAYIPTTDSWRELPSPPITQTARGFASLWVDEQFIVIGSTQMAAYRPSTNTWELLAPPPLELSISPPPSVIAVEGALVIWPRSINHRRTGLAYSVATDAWSELPEPPLTGWPAVADLAWTGGELIIVGGLPSPFAGDSERLVGSTLDWVAKEWTTLPDVWPEPIPSEGNLGSESILWTGDVLVVLPGSVGSGVDPLDGAVATYNPATNQWRQLPSIGGAIGWNSPLIQAGGDVLALVSGQLHRINASPDAGIPIDSSGLPEATTPPFTDIALRGVPLTLVGKNGNGADIVVLDLDFGLETIYRNGEHHQLGSGGLIDMAMADRSLYVWGTPNGPTIKFNGGPTPFDGRGDRLTFGEIAQPGDVVEAGGSERFVLPVAGSGSFWVWEVDGDGASASLITSAAQAGAVAPRVSFPAEHAPRGVGADGSLVFTDWTNVFQLRPGGEVIDLGAGDVVVIAGQEVLIQECADDECFRRWVDLESGKSREGGSDDTAWSGANQPLIPSHSAPIDAAAPADDQILVFVSPASDRAPPSAVDFFSPPELLRVDVTTMAQEVVPLPDGVRPGLAAWSRDGKNIVAISNNDVIVVDLATGQATTYAGLIPEGFFVLAAG